MSDALDNSAYAALLMLLLNKSPKYEHLGALYSDGSGYGRTGTVDGGASHTQGTLRVPPGMLAALFHNHPTLRTDAHEMKGVKGGEEFSEDDKTQARKLKVPSYIITPSGKLRKFDPSTGETTDVVAEFPIEEYMRTAGAHNILAK